MPSAPAPPGRPLDSVHAPAPPDEFIVGVMTMEAEGKDSARFHRLVEEATASVDARLAKALGVRVELIAFEGPHLTPAAGAYAPLDFLQIGLTEKLERGVHFLLVVTEVDLAANTLSYTLALPSQLTNVAIVSTKRLDPSFWGDEQDDARVAGRLSTLLLHSFGHLLNLSHHPDPANAMYDFAGVDALDLMGALGEDQRAQMRRALPEEAHERTTTDGHLGFIFHTLLADWKSIGRAVARAHPLRLLSRLPTMITAALSVIIVLFFSAEVWDVGSTVELYQLAAFSVAAVLGSTAVLYRTFAFSGVLGRGRVLAESTVVTAAATAISLLLTMTMLFVLFTGFTYLGTATIFPKKLMATWPTVDPATKPLDHFNLSLFVAALGVLAGSLGGRADSKDLIRAVLFVDEET